MQVDKETQQEMSRRGFFKLGLAGISASALLFLSGCLGEEKRKTMTTSPRGADVRRGL